MLLHNVILVFHVIVAVALVALVLVQQGKGADAGAAFGSGASGTVFGAQGSGSFLTRVTGVLAALFFATSLTLFVMATQQKTVGSSVVDKISTTGQPANTPQQKSSEVDVPVDDVPADGVVTKPSKSKTNKSGPDVPAAD